LAFFSDLESAKSLGYLSMQVKITSQVFTIPEVALMAVFGSHGHCCELHISNGDARESFQIGSF
jgi:3-dehydroquinate dehydratase